MKKNIFAMKFFCMLFIACVSSCAEAAKISAVASLFPQYDFAKKIAGDLAEVTLLLPPGAESHAYEPRPADMVRIAEADMFIYTGDSMEPWAGRLVSGMSGGPKVVDASDGVELMRSGEDEHDHEDHDHAHEAHDHGGFDPHIWLDPMLAVKMAENIVNAFIELDPENTGVYEENFSRLAGELRALDAETRAIVAAAKRNTLVFGSRFAYMYFINRYGLDFVSAYDSCGVHAEPSVREVMEVVKFVRENDIPCIYHEEFSDPKVARTIAAETGAKLLLFSTAHNVTRADLEAGVSFVEIMRQNINNVKQGLE